MSENIFHRRAGARASVSPRAGSLARSRHRIRQSIAGHGNPIPFLRKGSRDELPEATGATKLPALKLPDGTAINHSRAILTWLGKQS